MAWRETDALGRNQVVERVMGSRQVLIDGLEHLLGGVRPGDGQHLWMLVADTLGVGAQAAGDDDLAVGLERFAYGFQGLIYGAVNEAAGVDHDQVCGLVAG